mgnify:CR=1 FL=1|jgi:hypothetical protein
MAKTSPMQRSLKVIKDAGLPYWKVEYWQPWARRRIDLFNIIDLIVLDSGIIGVQITGADIASHRIKILETEKNYTIAWLKSGGLLEVHSWRNLVVKRGMKAKKWNCKIADVLLVNGELYWEERNEPQYKAL